MTDNLANNVLPLPEGAPDWALVLNSNICVLAESVASIQEKHAKILGVVEELKPDVMAVINGLQKNPMFKMLLGGK